MTRKFWMLGGATTVLLAASLPAAAHGWHEDEGWHGGWRHRPRTVVVQERVVVRHYAPPPVYVPAPVVYAPPPPVIVRPPVYAPAVYAPAVYAPPPVYAPAPVVVGPGTGTVLGAIAGAAVGSQIGRGDGRTAAIAIGTVLGAAMGSGR